MQQLEIRRLSPAESNELRVLFLKEPTSTLPDWVSLRQLCDRLGKAKSSLFLYRQIAIAEIDEYFQLSLQLNPGYLLGDVSTPDKPPFSRRQAEILEEISKLFDASRNEKLVISTLRQRYPRHVGN